MSGPNNRKEPDVRRRRRISGLDEEGHMNPDFLVPLIPIVAIIAVAAVKIARLRATRPESPSSDGNGWISQSVCSARHGKSGGLAARDNLVDCAA